MYPTRFPVLHHIFQGRQKSESCFLLFLNFLLQQQNGVQVTSYTLHPLIPSMSYFKAIFEAAFNIFLASFIPFAVQPSGYFLAICSVICCSGQTVGRPMRRLREHGAATEGGRWSSCWIGTGARAVTVDVADGAALQAARRGAYAATLHRLNYHNQ